MLVITILQDKPIHIVWSVLTQRALDGKHTVFGHVTNGMDVVNAITGGDKIEKIEVLDSTDDLFAADGLSDFCQSFSSFTCLYASQKYR